jgi:hypothetical protein
MCVDYIDLNKAGKKEPFGLPRIDQVVDSTIGCKFSQLLLGVSSDSPKGGRPDQDIFHHSVQCILLHNYAFGLKSVGATYQQGIQRCLYSQLLCNVEAYADDVDVKTREKEGTHL